MSTPAGSPPTADPFLYRPDLSQAGAPQGYYQKPKHGSAFGKQWEHRTNNFHSSDLPVFRIPVDEDSKEPLITRKHDGSIASTVVGSDDQNSTTGHAGTDLPGSPVASLHKRRNSLLSNRSSRPEGCSRSKTCCCSVFALTLGLLGGGFARFMTYTDQNKHE